MQKFEQNPVAYLTPDPRRKDYYDWALGVLRENDCQSVLDAGCASGDFLYHLPDSLHGIGLDKSEELIDFAQKNRNKKNLSFIVADFLNDVVELNEISRKLSVDALTIFGTITTVKNITRLLDLIDIFKPRVLLINDYFNPEPVDTFLSYCDSNNNEYQEGFNIYSLSTIRTKLMEKEFVKLDIKSYAPTAPIKKVRTSCEAIRHDLMMKR